jgi:hypothetical protein
MPNAKKTLVPEFSSEGEERRFWAEHDSTEFIGWAAATRRKLPDLKPTPRTIDSGEGSHTISREEEKTASLANRAGSQLRAWRT